MCVQGLLRGLLTQRATATHDFQLEATLPRQIVVCNCEGPTLQILDQELFAEAPQDQSRPPSSSITLFDDGRHSL